ncbi:MAG: hypothetical protein IJR49_02095 [Treponema sp.]|nr:hypothetical protein [Treponema sp.]
MCQFSAFRNAYSILSSRGFTRWQCECVRAMCLAENGIIIVCGEEKSGKSNTASIVFSEAVRIKQRRVILIDEVRNYETIKRACNLAAKGALIIAVVKSDCLEKGLERFLNSFVEEKKWISLTRAIIYQKIIDVKNKKRMLVDVAFFSKKFLYSLFNSRNFKNMELRQKDIKSVMAKCKAINAENFSPSQLCEQLEHNTNIIAEILHSLKSAKGEERNESRLAFSA